ncbi:putative RNA-binding protein (Jag domain) [Campylobacter porcelli]|uniref:Putative RNA-binding protein (Jag domain) n=1 Tax=Campylobacter porcelli TaxID=1660073 RepID=A0A1X9SV49_9BACT|nr:putative RNA-binding protein (Jag domain) [Campylobacter sp. RM6137]
MGIKIEAKDLQSAYIKAANELKCSAINLEITQIKAARKGFLGFFKKDGIFEVSVKKDGEKRVKKPKNDRIEKSIRCDKAQKFTHSKFEPSSEDKFEPNITITQSDTQAEAQFAKPARKSTLNIDQSIFDSFHKIDDNQTAVSLDNILLEIRAGLDRLFGASLFDIQVSELSIYDADTIYIKLDGADAALMIGKEGYRYKAISYLIFNWINAKYNKGIRLEIAEFLKNQESSMAVYLNGVIERVELIGRAQTKPLDGVLVKIALEQLRQRFPDKYVGIKSSDEGKFIVINDFHKK